MNEQEWLVSENPLEMLEQSLQNLSWKGPRFSDRKLRLFALACSRALHPNGYWEGNQEHDIAVYTHAEMLADGVRNPQKIPGFSPYCEGLACLVRSTGEHSAWQTVSHMVCDWEKKIGADFLREINGNPYSPVVLPTSPAGLCAACGSGYHDHCGAQVSSSGIRCGCQVCWGPSCPWLTPQVLSLAEATYYNRIKDGLLDSQRLAVLSDALEEAGCTDRNILTHLRSPGPHVKGCWAVDLILGRD